MDGYFAEYKSKLITPEKAVEDLRRSVEENPAALESRGLLAACRFLASDVKG